ncbi:hypothetical protein [Bradyrhizobium sp. USDA 3650]
MALVNGYMIMLDALRAATATAPAEALLNWIGWRRPFEVLAASSATTAAVIYRLVPERDAAMKTVYTDGGSGQLRRCLQHVSDPHGPCSPCGQRLG